MITRAIGVGRCDGGERRTATGETTREVERGAADSWHRHQWSLVSTLICRGSHGARFRPCCCYYNWVQVSCFLLWWFSSVRVLLCQQHLILNSKSAHFEVGWWFLHRFCVIYAGAVPAPPRLWWRDDYNDNMLRHTIAAQPTASCSTALKHYHPTILPSE